MGYGVSHNVSRIRSPMGASTDHISSTLAGGILWYVSKELAGQRMTS